MLRAMIVLSIFFVGGVAIILGGVLVLMGVVSNGAGHGTDLSPEAIRWGFWLIGSGLLLCCVGIVFCFAATGNKDGDEAHHHQEE